MSKVSSNSSADRGGGAFLSTRWSLVITARGPTSTVAQSALDELCRIYWYPLYCFIRRRGYTPADAEDLVQGFFVHMFRRHFFEQADPAQGRLRGFLLQSLDYFLTDQHRHQAAIKRGGEVEIVPLDLTGVQERYSHEPATNETPEECYDRQWALLLLQRVIATLGEMWRQKGKAELYAALTPYFYAELDGANAEALAIRFRMTTDNMKKILSRLKDDFRAVFHQEVRDIVATPADAEAEIAAFRAALRGRAV